MTDVLLPTGWQPESDLLQDCVIAVTGAGAGIGRAAALALAAHGATVLLLGRTQSRLEAVADEISAAGGPEPVIQAVDLRGVTAEDCNNLAHAIDGMFGRLDGLLHNASLLGPRLPLTSYDPDAWREVMATNLDACFLLTQACLPLLEEGRDPLVLFTGSGAGLRPRAYWGAYAVSKAGLEALMKVFADEADNISRVRFASLNPGGTRTAMRAAAFPGEDPQTLPAPEDLMPLYLWLFGSSDTAINGRSIDARQWLGLS